jgi:hypothetical protein
MPRKVNKVREKSDKFPDWPWKDRTAVCHRQLSCRRVPIISVKKNKK